RLGRHSGLGGSEPLASRPLAFLINLSTERGMARAGALGAPPEVTMQSAFLKHGPETGDLRQTDFAPPAPPIHIGSDIAASRAFFGGFDAGWGAHDLENRLNHPTPANQFGIVLQGTFSITTTDGETRRLAPGSVFHLEDISPCKGAFLVPKLA